MSTAQVWLEWLGAGIGAASPLHDAVGGFAAAASAAAFRRRPRASFPYQPTDRSTVNPLCGHELIAGIEVTLQGERQSEWMFFEAIAPTQR